MKSTEKNNEKRKQKTVIVRINQIKRCYEIKLLLIVKLLDTIPTSAKRPGPTNSNGIPRSPWLSWRPAPNQFGSPSSRCHADARCFLRSTNGSPKLYRHREATLLRKAKVDSQFCFASSCSCAFYPLK